MKKFFRELLNPHSVTSSRRFVTLIMAIHLIVTSFLVSFFVFYLLLYTAKGSINKDLLDLLSQIIEYDVWIVCTGLGLIGAETLGTVLIEKARIKAATAVETGLPNADTINVDTVNVEQKSE